MIHVDQKSDTKWLFKSPNSVANPPPPPRTAPNVVDEFHDIMYLCTVEKRNINFCVVIHSNKKIRFPKVDKKVFVFPHINYAYCH